MGNKIFGGILSNGEILRVVGAKGENGTSDIRVNGTSVLDNNRVANIIVPTKVSDLPNDSDYQTAEDVAQAIGDLQDGITVEGETLII